MGLPDTRVSEQASAADVVHMARASFSAVSRNSGDRVSGEFVLRYPAYLFDEDGDVVKTKTLLATNSTKAISEARDLLKKWKGIAKDHYYLLGFMGGFWKIDSDYAKMKALRGFEFLQFSDSPRLNF